MSPASWIYTPTIHLVVSLDPNWTRVGTASCIVSVICLGSLISKEILKDQKESFFRATKEEMIQWGEFGHDSIELENGGYMAYLRAYGELHCMVRPSPEF